MSLLYSVILSCSFLSAISGNNLKNKGKIPLITLSLGTLLILTFLVQLIYPQALLLFRRDATDVFSGQLWRLLTSLFFQDGGLAGAVFNIAGLLFIGIIAERYFTKFQWLILFFIGGILTNCIALFWQPIGAGNSIANFSLAGGLLITVLLKSHNRTRVIALIGLAASILLLFMEDIHGAAVLIGICLWFILNMYS